MAMCRASAWAMRAVARSHLPGPGVPGQRAADQGDAGDRVEDEWIEAARRDQQPGDEQEHLVGDEGQRDPGLVDEQQDADEDGGDGAVQAGEKVHAA